MAQHSTDIQKLVMWRDLTPYPRRLVPTTDDAPHVLVVGAGVTGLVAAWVLLDRGYKVTILSKAYANYSTTPGERLTAQIAGALWEYPPAVCGSHTDTVSLAHSKRWCMTAYHAWDALAAVPAISRAAGVRMRPSAFFFPGLVGEDPAQLSKMLEIMASGVRGFKHGLGPGPESVGARGVDMGYGVADGYEVLAPVIDTDQAMVWLMSLVLGKGAATVTQELTGDLLELEPELRARFGADAIVNATGLSGSTIAGDASCYPLRGALLRVVNDGTDFPKIDEALSISADTAIDGEIVFIVPRNDNILLIGGVAQPNEGTLDLTLDASVIQRMRERAERFLPDLKRARLDPTYPLAQGLRPCRGRNVRVERELRRLPNATGPSRIVHSYGHGGSGWSLSFGCAADVIDLIEDALKDAQPVAMDSDSYLMVEKSCSGFCTPAAL